MQRADTLVSKAAGAQLQVFPHTARVVPAAHTQHCPLMSEQPPVNDVTEHGPFTLVTSVAAPQSQRSPHTAIVVFCVTWRYSAACLPCPFWGKASNFRGLFEFLLCYVATINIAYIEIFS